MLTTTVGETTRGRIFRHSEAVFVTTTATGKPTKRTIGTPDPGKGTIIATWQTPERVADRNLGIPERTTATKTTITETPERVTWPPGTEK